MRAPKQGASYQTSPELLNYIRNERLARHKDNDIKDKLISVGWQKEAVEKAMKMK